MDCLASRFLQDSPRRLRLLRDLSWKSHRSLYRCVPLPVRAEGRRYGLSLTEVIVVISLLGMIGATIGSAILNQQRFHRDASELLDVRQGVRDAMEVLSGDIRGSTPADTIRLKADSALELFTTIGTSVACRTASGTAIYIAAESSGNTLTSFLLAPDTGDLVLVFRTTGDPTVGTWERHRLAALTARSSRPGCLDRKSVV